MAEQLTLYSARISPYAQRIEIALAEVGAEYTRVEIDLQNKPVWFASKVNPAGEVPALTYGGPKVLPEQAPSPDSFKLAESLVILEFVADLFPNSNLLPKDPIQRARARFFIDAFNTKLFPGWVSFIMRGRNIGSFYAGLEAIQALLPDDKTFAVSNEFTIADAAIAPFLGRAFVLIESDIGPYAPGEGTKAWKVLNSPRFRKLLKYYKAIEARESFKSAFDGGYVKDLFHGWFSWTRARKLAA